MRPKLAPNPFFMISLPRSGVMAAGLMLLAGATVVSAAASGGAAKLSWERQQLSDQFFCEGAAFGDLNKDGHLDAVSGPYWYAGPDFKQRHDLYPAAAWDPLRYSDNFFAFCHDFNRDGWLDVLVLGFPGVDASWFENPGEKKMPWRRRVVFLPVDNESPTFGDLLGNGQPALICMANGKIGYATYLPNDPVRPWVWHPISPQGSWQRYTHGLGFGDVNGDGKNDILEKGGWWEQPKDLKGDPEWKKHAFTFGPPTARGGSQMYVMDVNGDGLNDVITALDAHGYGISWFEQVRGSEGEITFKEHRITGLTAEEKINGVQFSQPHAMVLTDVDGDGLKDLVTGKRWWAHGPKNDPDPNGTPVVYAFLTRRETGAGGAKTGRFEPLLIDDVSGIGVQLESADANKDGVPDFVVGNKKGTFVLLSRKSGAATAARE